ncbi:MAG: hypothetical protein IJA83_10435 [Clostridia bacterium]|nr:hypothetical protein [Clostridia bacterium]
MTKRFRQYAGLLAAIAAYYLIHEGAHLVYALIIGTFKQVNIDALGVQIDVYAEQMTDLQMGIFCIVGSVATLLTGWGLSIAADAIGRSPSKVFKACMYYVTIALLLIDPLYLSVLCGFFGGGDMNGIALLVPEMAARILYSAVLVINICLFWKRVLPAYKAAIAGQP